MLPESKADEKRKPNYQKNRQHNRELRRLRTEWVTMLGSPPHFARGLGMLEVFPEVSEQKLGRNVPAGRAEELKAQHEDLKERMRGSLERFRERQRELRESGVQPASSSEARRVIEEFNEDLSDLKRTWGLLRR